MMGWLAFTGSTVWEQRVACEQAQTHARDSGSRVCSRRAKSSSRSISHSKHTSRATPRMATYQHDSGMEKKERRDNEAAASKQKKKHGLQTKDSVGLFSQIGPEITLSAVLDALRDTPREEAIDTLYAVANIDVWNWRHTFFGRPMDLGLYDSFRRVLISEPFAALLGHTEREVTGAVRADSAHFLCRVRVVDAHLDTSFYTIFLSQNPSFNGSERWMFDRIVFDDTCRGAHP